MQLNGMTKRPMMAPQTHRPTQEMPLPMTPHHEEIIRYIYESKIYKLAMILSFFYFSMESGHPYFQQKTHRPTPNCI